MCIVCGIMQSVKILAIGYDPSAAEVEAITALFERIQIVSENRQQFASLAERIEHMQATVSDDNKQLKYMTYVAATIVEYFKLFEPSNCGCGIQQQP
jgi:hypothetical protein